METSMEKESKQSFSPDGDLTAATAQEIRIQLKDLIRRGLSELVIDLSNTRVIDSTGIGLLVATHNSLRRIDGTLTLINVSQELFELLKAFRLDKHFSITRDPRLTESTRMESNA
jgi:anti-anti-sigma factor